MTLPSELSAALNRLVDLVEAADSQSVRVAGTTVDLAADDARAQVADALYMGWYIALSEDDQTGRDFPRTGDMTCLLRAAHAGAEHFDPAWIVVSAAPDGHCQVSKGGCWRTVQPGEYVSPLRKGVPPTPGELLEIVRRHDWTDPQTGFWCAQSLDAPPEPPINRAYLDVSASTVAQVLHEVTARLERDGLRHSLKCPAIAEGYARVDSLVVYYERADEKRVPSLLTDAHARIGSLLRAPVPPLTQRLAPGLAHAEEPKGGGSFGQSRCHALAGGLVNALRRAATREELLASLLEGLHAEGIDSCQPWLAT